MQFAFDREGDPGALEIGALVVPVGCPDRRCWEPPVSGDRVISASSRRVRFESFFVSPGSSGGALFNQQWEVVGLVTEKNSQDGVAVGMREVADRLKKWGYTVQLRPTSIPRAGYRTGLSLVGLAPTDRRPDPIGPLAEWAIRSAVPGSAADRLAPDGASVWHRGTWRSPGAWWGPASRSGPAGSASRPSREVGVARVNGRFNAGSYFIQTASGPVAVPIWQTRDQRCDRGRRWGGPGVPGGAARGPHRDGGTLELPHRFEAHRFPTCSRGRGSSLRSKTEGAYS